MPNPFDQPEEPKASLALEARNVLVSDWLASSSAQAKGEVVGGRKTASELAERNRELISGWQRAFGADFELEEAEEYAQWLTRKLAYVSVEENVEPKQPNVVSGVPASGGQGGEMPKVAGDGEAGAQLNGDDDEGKFSVRGESPLAQRDVWQGPDAADKLAEESGGLASLQRAITRAREGGRPLSILHYGASHVAGGTEAQTIFQLFQEQTPTTYSTKAKIGVSAAYPLDHKESWLDMPIRATNPDLIIIAFGNNEAAGTIDEGAYEKRYEQLVREVQSRAPDASIVLVGPTDGCSIRGANKGHLLPGLAQVIHAQKEVAAKLGLDYFDFQAAMGGRNSIYNWKRQGLVSQDMLHFSRQGYQILGKMLFDHVMEASQPEK